MVLRKALPSAGSELYEAASIVAGNNVLQRNCRIPLLELARRVISHCSLLAGFCLKSIKMMTQEEEKITVFFNSE